MGLLLDSGLATSIGRRFTMAAAAPAAGVPAAPAYLAVHAAKIAAMDRTPVGMDLVAAVVKRLQDMAEEPDEFYGKQAMICGGGQHRDYCGIGVWYKKDTQEYSVGSVCEGFPWETMKIFKCEDEFLQWLARRSDFSLCGASSDADHLPQEREEFNFNNQRLTRDLLARAVRGE